MCTEKSFLNLKLEIMKEMHRIHNFILSIYLKANQKTFWTILSRHVPTPRLKLGIHSVSLHLEMIWQWWFKSNCPVRWQIIKSFPAHQVLHLNKPYLFHLNHQSKFNLNQEVSNYSASYFPLFNLPHFNLSYTTEEKLNHWCI